MAYVDHAFSITDDDDDILMDSSSFTVRNRPPIKEIGLAFSLLIFGTLGLIFGTIMAVNKVGGDRTHGKLYIYIYSFSSPFSLLLLLLLFHI